MSIGELTAWLSVPPLARDGSKLRVKAPPKKLTSMLDGVPHVQSSGPEMLDVVCRATDTVGDLKRQIQALGGAPPERQAGPKVDADAAAGVVPAGFPYLARSVGRVMLRKAPPVRSGQVGVLDAGAEVTLASIKGGAIPVDQRSVNADGENDASVERYLKDDALKAEVDGQARHPSLDRTRARNSRQGTSMGVARRDETG